MTITLNAHNSISRWNDDALVRIVHWQLKHGLKIIKMAQMHAILNHLDETEKCNRAQETWDEYFSGEWNFNILMYKLTSVQVH